MSTYTNPFVVISYSSLTTIYNITPAGRLQVRAVKKLLDVSRKWLKPNLMYRGDYRKRGGFVQ